MVLFDLTNGIFGVKKIKMKIQSNRSNFTFIVLY